MPAIKAACGPLPLQLHSHCLTGLAPYTACLAIELGVDVVHTATSTLANGASHPATEVFVHNARREGFDIPIDLVPVEEVAERLRYIAKREGKPVGIIAEYDAFHYKHQMPGGMVSNLKSQLAPLGIADRLPEVLEEAARVRCDLGYPIIVSPFAQFVMTQAVLNVMGKERYATVPDEVRKYVLGYYGEIAGPIDPNCSTASPGAPSRPRRARAICSNQASRGYGASAAHSLRMTICCSPRFTPNANTTCSRPPGRSRRTIRWRRRRLSRSLRKSRNDARFARSTSSTARSREFDRHDNACPHHRGYYGRHPAQGGHTRCSRDPERADRIDARGI